MLFVIKYKEISHLSKHIRYLITAEGNIIKSSHAGKILLTTGIQPVFVSALVVPSFKDNLISVGGMTKGQNVLFTNKEVYLSEKTLLSAYAKFIGGRGSDNLYNLSREYPGGTSSLHANQQSLRYQLMYRYTKPSTTQTPKQYRNSRSLTYTRFHSSSTTLEKKATEKVRDTIRASLGKQNKNHSQKSNTQPWKYWTRYLPMQLDQSHQLM